MLKKHAIMLATLLLTAGAISLLGGCVVYSTPYPYYPYPSYYGGGVVPAPIIVHRHYW